MSIQRNINTQTLTEHDWPSVPHPVRTLIVLAIGEKYETLFIYEKYGSLSMYANKWRGFALALSISIIVIALRHYIKMGWDQIFQDCVK